MEVVSQIFGGVTIHLCCTVYEDIDILVQETDFETAAELLTADDYTSETTQQKSPAARHIEYYKDGIMIELHRYFSDADKDSEYFTVSKAQLNEDRVSCFPSVENGISMLLHFQFHLGRVGLRHYMNVHMNRPNTV